MFAALGAHPWAYPMLEVAHILGIAMILGNLVLLEMRVFGLAADLSVESLARLSLALVGIGFSVAAASGLLMFATQAEELLANRAFTAKVLLLMLAACNAGWFHARHSRQRLDGVAKALMVVSTVIWLLVVTCGRWIAYV